LDKSESPVKGGHIDVNSPLFADRLPALAAFVRDQAGELERGVLRERQSLDQRIRVFCNSERMREIEAVAPGWQAMAQFADGATLIHVVKAMIALQLLPEYRGAPSDLRAMMEWSVFYHDIGKQAVAGKRDALHAFRSAALTARALPLAGFGTARPYAESLESWVALALSAFLPAPDGNGFVQDNRALPRILAGSEQLFGTRSPAALIVQAVLLHQSLDVVPEWPNAASLTEAEAPQCVSPALLPLLEGVMLVDSDAWQLLDPPRKAHFRQSTLAAFERVRRLVIA
jgi:hypothetical protein